MKRLFLVFVTSFSFLSMNCYGDNIDYLQQVLFDLVVNEDLFSRADENKQIISSSGYIYSVDQALQNFTYNYSSLQSYNKVELLGVIQIMLTSGLIKSNGSNNYSVAYNDQTTLEILIAGLANDQEKMTQLIEAINEFIVVNLRQFPSSGDFSETIDDEITTMMTLNNCLTQLSLNPLLITKSDFLNNLYQAFQNAEPLLGKYGQDLMLFDLDLVGAGLYQYDSYVLPPISLKPLFQSASDLQPLVVSLITGANQLFLTQMNAHLQMGINSMKENGF